MLSLFFLFLFLLDRISLRYLHLKDTLSITRSCPRARLETPMYINVVDEQAERGLLLHYITAISLADDNVF